MIKKELLKSREDVLKSDAYWTTGIQIALYNCAVKFKEEKGMNRAQLAELSWRIK